jgi:hypothetical protein
MVYVHVKLTIVLCRCVQPQLDQLQLVDLVRKDLDKVLEDGYPLRLALLGVVELDESIGELVPQLALPEVLELEEEVLHIIASLLALLRQEASDLLAVHFGDCGVVVMCRRSRRQLRLSS